MSFQFQITLNFSKFPRTFSFIKSFTSYTIKNNSPLPEMSADGSNANVDISFELYPVMTWPPIVW